MDPLAAGWNGRRWSGQAVEFTAAGRPINIGRIAGITAVIPGDETGAYQMARQFAQAKTAHWGLKDDTEFVLLNAISLKNGHHATLQQAYGGIPVYGSRVWTFFGRDGKLGSLSVKVYPARRIESTFALSEGTALRSLTNDPSAEIDFANRVLYPRMEGEELVLVAAWQIRAITDREDFRPEGLIDARTGELLIQYNDVAFDDVAGHVSGLVLPLYWDDTPQAWDQSWQRVQVVGQGYTHTDFEGDYLFQGLTPGSYDINGSLYGSYVNVNWEDGPDASYEGNASTGVAHNWLWDYEMAREDELNLYYHTTLVHDYFKALQEEFTNLDYPLPATCAVGTNYENAYWNGQGIYFGEGGGGTFRNFALFCDVIYHEYTHGVTDMIYPQGMLPYSGQSGALNEAWSDYFACTITDEPQMGEGGLYTNGQVMRDLDNTLRYPDNWAGEVHADGRIVGGAFWDLRELVGASTSDSLLHFAKYFLAEDFESYFMDVLVNADDDGDLSNGGPHHPEIYEAFGMHGIGPGLEPVLAIEPTAVLENGTGGSIGNGDGFFDPGETLSMSFTVSDLRYLYPPAAQDVSVSVYSDDPHLMVSPETFYLGDINAGQSVSAPENLLIEVADGADLAFSNIYFEISANSGTYQITDQVEIIVGHPNILLVDDDGGDEYESFLDSGLRNGGNVFSVYDILSQGELQEATMNQFDILVWMTGDQSTGTLTAGDRFHLESYLSGGGRLLLSGQDLVEDIGSTSFFGGYLGASPLAGSVSNFLLDGVDEDPVSDGMWLMILGAGAANNQVSPATIAALPGAQEMFYYRSETETLPAAVRYDSGTYKTATFAFGLEAVSGLAASTTQAEVLNATLAWLGLETAVEEEENPALVKRFVLGDPYPNPFNPSVTIPFELPTGSQVTIDIYNLQGQHLGSAFEGRLEAGSQAVQWNASTLSSGMYFLKIRAEQGTGSDAVAEIRKVMLLK